MRFLIVYASTEGQTRKIARVMFDWLAAAGHSVELLAADEADALDPGAFDAAIVAGSVHAGRYQAALAGYVREAGPRLSAMPSMFVSVSLTAAFDVAEDWVKLKDQVVAFLEETGWTPGRVEHVAGAFRFSEYDFFKAWAMRWIASDKDKSVRPGEDKEYTDWAALEAALRDWTSTISAGRTEASGRG